MKLVINIPCYNEEKTLPLVLEELPKTIEGMDEIEIQIVDDGSKDNTAALAKKHGCFVIKHKRNLGLGTAFKHGVEAALSRGADIFVNTDADNQYPSKYIPGLVRPVLEQKADVVIGNREPWNVKHFSPLKRFLQYVGNGVTRKIAGGNVPDTVSGFRAYNKEALLKLNVTTKFSYVLDTIVQAHRKGLTTESIPIKTNAPTRHSRLFKNIWQHMRKSGGNVLRCYALYEPFKTFTIPAVVFLLPGIFLLLRFFYFFLQGEGGHVQSLIVATILFMLAGMFFGLAILAEIQALNRKLLEEQLYLQKKKKYE